MLFTVVYLSSANGKSQVENVQSSTVNWPDTVSSLKLLRRTGVRRSHGERCGPKALMEALKKILHCTRALQYSRLVWLKCTNVYHFLFLHINIREKLNKNVIHFYHIGGSIDKHCLFDLLQIINSNKSKGFSLLFSLFTVCCLAKTCFDNYCCWMLFRAHFSIENWTGSAFIDD